MYAVLGQAQNVATYPPIIGDNGKWKTYDKAIGGYTDSGKPSRGEQGIPGPKGDPGEPGQKGEPGKDGLGLPAPTAQDAGKVPMVNPEGNGYELGEVAVDAYTKAESDKRYMPLAAGIKPIKSGELVTLTDSADFALQGLKIYGKSTQEGEPTPENPIPIVSVGEGGDIDVTITGENMITRPYIGIPGLAGESGEVKGIKVTIDDMGRIHFNGTATGKITYRVRNGPLPEGSYTGAVFCDKENSGITLNWYYATIVWDKINKFQATIKRNYQLGISIAEGTVCDDIVVSPVLVLGTFDAIGYIPPQSQSLPISTPNGLPGIPVKSGGNYTDSNGQQWVCDEIDFARGKWVQRTMITHVLQVDGYHDAEGFGAVLTENLLKTGTRVEIISNYFTFSKTNKEDGVCFGFSGVIRLYNKLGSREKFNQWLSDKKVMVCYPLETPIEHDLTPELITKFEQLHTYYPTTNLFASDNAGVDVQYLADTKLYIDSKLQSLVAQYHANQAAMLSLMPLETQATMIENDTDNILSQEGI